jgi:hypothetical protein
MPRRRKERIRTMPAERCRTRPVDGLAGGVLILGMFRSSEVVPTHHVAMCRCPLPRPVG